MKKIILYGLVGGVIMLAAGMITSQVFHALIPSLTTEFENRSLFRASTDPIMFLYFLHPFFLGVALAWLWSKAKSIIPAESDTRKGIRFGLSIWFALTLPGMLISYASFPISLMMIASWTIGTLVQLCCVGIFFSKVLK